MPQPTQCTEIAHPAKATRRSRGLLPIFILGVSAGVFTPASGESLTAGEASPAARPESSLATPWNSDFAWDLIRDIYFLLGGDPDGLPQGTDSLSIQTAMTQVTLQYAACGVPSDLSDSDRNRLKDDLHQIACMCRSAPLSINLITLNTFLKTVSSVWIDLGLYPGDLGGC
jgi:hypothetical protein